VARLIKGRRKRKPKNPSQSNHSEKRWPDGKAVLYFVKRIKSGGVIVRAVEHFSMENLGGEKIEMESRYKIKNGACSCKAFKFNNDCKHLLILETDPNSGGIAVAGAKHIIYGLVNVLKPHFKIIKPAEEPFEYDITDSWVEKINIEATMNSKSTLLNKGLWWIAACVCNPLGRLQRYTAWVEIKVT